MSKNVIIIVSATILVIIIGALVYNWRKKEAFCGTCQGIGNKVCPNRKMLHKLYNEGKLTEFTTNLEQNKNQWPETSWDIFFKQEDTKIEPDL